MASVSSVLCKICNRNCDEGYKPLEDTTIRQLSIVCYNLAIKISARSVICKHCEDLLNTFCEVRYKLDGTCPTLLSEVKNEPNPFFGFLTQKFSVDHYTVGEQIICRLCSAIASYHATDQIMQLFPDLDPVYISSPNLCQKCMSMLNELAEFKRTCFKISNLSFNEIKIEESQELKLADCFTRGYYLQVEKCSSLTKKYMQTETDLLHSSSSSYNNISRESEIDSNSDLHKYKIFCQSFHEIEIKPLRRNETILYICPQCKQAVKDIESHIKEHNDIFNKITYGCKYCQYRHESVTEIKNHHCSGQRKSESPEALYKCDMCPFRARQKGNLKTHQLIHKAPDEIEMFKCPHCKFQSRQKGNLQTHLLVHKKPNDIDMFKCPHCVYQSRQKGNLQTHILKKHKGSHEVELTRASFRKCKECPFMAKKYSTIKKHMSVCHPRQ